VEREVTTMNVRLTELATRRAGLVAAAAEQRRLLADELTYWEAPLLRIERVLTRVVWVREHLHWLVAAGAAIAASPTARDWLRRGWQLWRAARRLRTSPEH
jgi:hypothetical protein